jgi:hypothetical protein
MQVCRQLRAEFRPLYLGKPIHVRLSAISKFVQHYLPPSKDLKSPIHLVVDIQRHLGLGPVDILPVLYSIIAREKIKIEFKCKGRGRKLAKALSKAFRCRRQQWQELIRGNVSKIFLRPFENGLTIAFLEGAFENWIAEKSFTTRKEFCADLGFKAQSKRRMLELLSDVDFRKLQGRGQLLYGNFRKRVEFVE